jgi:hypothetical protein
MRAAHAQVSFADLEFIRQGVELEPTLKAVATFLDQHGAIVDRVRRDLLRGLKQPRTGRAGLTPQQVLRALILMRVKNWDYRELRERIADGVPPGGTSMPSMRRILIVSPAVRISCSSSTRAAGVWPPTSRTAPGPRFTSVR